MEIATRSSRSKTRSKPRRSASHSPPGVSHRLYDPLIQNIKKEKKKKRSTTPTAIPVPPAPTPVANLTSSIDTSRQGIANQENGYFSFHFYLDCLIEKRSLQLRLQGQLQSIRVLETQLAEATQLITAKDNQLREVMKRLQTIELREKKRLKRELEERQQGSNGNQRLKLEEKKVLQLQVPPLLFLHVMSCQLE